MLILLFVTFLHSCSDPLEIKLTEPDDLIVVDGWIEYGRQARVFLTMNSPYFTSIDSASLRNLVLSRALVTLDDGEKSEVLILRKDERYFPPYYYAGNTIYGDTGKTYTLTAFFGEKTATAKTTVPSKVDIKRTSFKLLEDSDSLGNAVLVFDDPENEKNYYRIFSKRLGKEDRFYPTMVIALNDQYFNGEEVTFSFAQPPSSFLSTEGASYFSIEDTVVVKLVTMDQASFNFWDTYQQEVLNATNPFASSMINLESNIEGAGLGVWAGYGVSIDTVIASEFLK
ncbi:DUF4249 domain-containing protein [Bacteroidota bacterium]